MINTERFMRQLTLIDMERLANTQIILIGVGGIGSNLALNLAKMGARNIEVWDDDTLEEHNISNQMYPSSFVGKPKAEGCAEFIHFMEGYRPEYFEEKFRESMGHEDDAIYIVGVDSMSARSGIWDRLKEKPFGLFIDCRMGATSAQINVVSPSNREWYAGTLYSDADAVDLPCTARSTIYAPSFISATVCSQVASFVNMGGVAHTRGVQIMHDLNDHSHLVLNK